MRPYRYPQDAIGEPEAMRHLVRRQLEEAAWVLSQCDIGARVDGGARVHLEERVDVLEEILRELNALLAETHAERRN